MTRSRRRKLARLQSAKRRPVVRSGIPVASALLAAVPAAYAQEQPSGGLEEVVVTAQKVSENLQNVPIGVQVFDNAQLEQLGIVNLDDYVKFAPSASYVRSTGQGGNAQPGESHVYIRGVVSGGEGNHSGPQPSVGTYLDEQPVTTIDGNVDVHLYDIARIEVLAGPQGTLFGASSESGTVRIISNKPDPTKFTAGYDLKGNTVDHGGTGWEAEGFVNIPMSSWAAVRLVGWDVHDAGFINNVSGTTAPGCITNGVRTFPNWSGQQAGYNPGFPGTAAGVVTPYPCGTAGTIGAGAINNASSAHNHYNKADTKGGRATMRFNLGDNWTVTPTVMGQSVTTEGFFAYDPSVADLAVVHYGPEAADDNWYQTALTVEGKISNFDLVYAGSFMKRDTHTIADYADYSIFYDRVYGSGTVWQGNGGTPVMPQEFVNGVGYFQKWSQELRVTTPQDQPVKATVGGFLQRQLHNIFQQYTMPGYGFVNVYGSPSNPAGFADNLSIPTLNQTIWLTDEQRVDRDKALFGQVTWDINQQWSLTGGLRWYKFDNSLQGFFGFSANYDALAGFSSGMSQCFGPPSTKYAPCTNLDKSTNDTGTVPRVNLTYHVTPEQMLYATFSKGFRPGGVNRTAVAAVGPYQADKLTNYELGWKTQWFGHHFRWNGALFWEDWNKFLFSFLGPNSVNIVANGGNARIKGIENQLDWAATNNLLLTANFTFLDPVLTENYCSPNLAPGVTDCPNLVTPQAFIPPVIGPLAPKGTNLPVTPKFKGDLIARYSTDLGNGWAPYGQVAWVYQTQTSPILRIDQAANTGMLPAYGLVDLAAGANYKNFRIELSVVNVADRRAQVSRFTATNAQVDNQSYIVPTQPRTIGLSFAQRF